MALLSRSKSPKSFEEYVDQYYQYWQRLVNNTELQKLFSPIWRDVEHVWTREIFAMFSSLIITSLIGQKITSIIPEYFEAKTFLHGLFVVEDKLAMAHGLENRVPFMDNDLVDFAMQCPVRFQTQ